MLYFFHFGSEYSNTSPNAFLDLLLYTTMFLQTVPFNSCSGKVYEHCFMLIIKPCYSSSIVVFLNLPQHQFNLENYHSVHPNTFSSLSIKIMHCSQSKLFTQLHFDFEIIRNIGMPLTCSLFDNNLPLPTYPSDADMRNDLKELIQNNVNDQVDFLEWLSWKFPAKFFNP